MPVYKCVNGKGGILKGRDGAPQLVEASDRGSAKAVFKRHHGEKPTPAGKARHTTRRRLPVGYRVRLESF